MENKPLKSFKDLIVWQKAVDLAALVYSVTEKFPKSELYGITNQIRRSAVSISSNIAEGFKRSHGKEKLQFYNIAYGSTAELESQIEVSYKLNFLDSQDYQKLNVSVVEVGKMIDGLIKSQNKKSPKSYILNSIFFLLALYSTFYILYPTASFAASLFFGSHSQAVGLGQTFEVGVFLNTEGEPINAVEGKINYPAGAFAPLDVYDGNSLVNFWIERPHLESLGVVRFSGVIPGGYEGRSGYLFSIIFRATTVGTLTLSTTDERLLLNDGQGSKASVHRAPLQLRVVKQAPAEGFLPPHDTDPPEPFTPTVAHDPALFGDQWFLVFATQDKGSGIDHYEVYEDIGFRIQNLGKMIKKILYPKSYILNTWGMVESPYVLKDQKLRSFVYVKAVDKAGNQRIAVVEPRYPIQWYELWWIWVIIILGLVVTYLVTRVLWKKKLTRI